MKNYYYQEIPNTDYQEWADIANESGQIPLLPVDRVKKLRELFSQKAPLSEQAYKDSVDWLKGLQWEVWNVWSAVQREASGMGSLVSDFEAIYRPR